MNDMVPIKHDTARVLTPERDHTPAVPSNPVENVLNAPLSRRGFLGRVRDGAATTMGAGLGAGSLYGGYKAYGALTAPRQCEVAMLRLDGTLNPDGTPNEHQAFSLDHRVATEQDPNNKQAHDTEQQIDVSANALSLKPSGSEALVLAPDLVIHANNPDAKNIGGHTVSLANTPSDVFIPFQLLENAQSATFSYDEHGALKLTITSLPVEKEPTAWESAQAAAETARRTAACGVEKLDNARKLPEPMDALKPYVPESLYRRNPEEDCKPLPPNPKEYLTTTSTITLAGADKLHLPNIHLYDNRRFNADYHLTGLELHERIFKGHGAVDLLANNLTGKAAGDVIAGAANRNFNDPKLQRDFVATRLGVSSEFSNSLVEQLASFTKNWDFNPEGLSTPERHALNMTVDFKQREFEGKPWQDRLAIRAEEALGIPTR